MHAVLPNILQAQAVVLSLLIDAQSQIREHRRLLLNPSLTKIGIVVAANPECSMMSVLEFASAVSEEEEVGQNLTLAYNLESSWSSFSTHAYRVASSKRETPTWMEANACR